MDILMSFVFTLVHYLLEISSISIIATSLPNQIIENIPSIIPMYAIDKMEHIYTDFRQGQDYLSGTKTTTKVQLPDTSSNISTVVLDLPSIETTATSLLHDFGHKTLQTVISSMVSMVQASMEMIQQPTQEIEIDGNDNVIIKT